MSLIENLKIGKRLGLGFGLVIAMIIVLAVVAWSMLRANRIAVEQVVDDRYPKVRISHAVQALVHHQVGNLRGASTAALAGDTKTAEEMLGVLAKQIASNTELLSELKGMISTPKGEELFKSITQTRERYGAVRDEAVKMLREGRPQEGAKLALGTVHDRQQDFNNALEAFAKFQEGLMVKSGEEAKRDAGLVSTITVAIAGVVIVLSLAFGVIITKSITKPIEDALGVARAVTAGDLTVQINATAKDETGQLLAALKEMTENLQLIVNTVRSGSESVASASSQIAQGNQDLSARTESQASALQETAASMEELSSTVKQNADNSREANQLAQNASTVAVQGGVVVAKVVETMKEINDSSKQIADIISVIDGIAFQTNILALNAAVEAARAGEQGRGFAVVAGEVRSLAGRSAEAAKEIKALITNSVTRVEQGTQLVGQAGSTMEEVVSSIRRVTDIMGEISAASSEQSAGVSQIGEAVTQMDQATQQNAALVEEMAAAASSLRGQAQDLVQAVSVFKTGQITTVAAAHQPESSAAAAKYQQAIANTAHITAVAKYQSKVSTPKTTPEVRTAKASESDAWESF